MGTSDPLENILNPVHRKGATEEHIFADKQKAKMTAALIGAAFKPMSNKARLRLAARLRPTREGGANG